MPPSVRPDGRVVRFKRLSASLHVKERRGRMYRRTSIVFQTPFGITACESTNARCHRSECGLEFQTPFGITACESRCLACSCRPTRRFKRLSASLHVKGRRRTIVTRRGSSFKRLSASLHVKVENPHGEDFSSFGVSNAFRHHCM